MIMMPIESSSKFQSEPKPQTLAEHQRSAALRATGTRLGESDEDCGAPLSIRTPPKPASSAYRVGGAAAAGRRPATRAPGAPPAKAYDLCPAATPAPTGPRPVCSEPVSRPVWPSRGRVSPVGLSQAVY